MYESGLFDWLACLAEGLSANGGVKQAEYDVKARQDMAAWAFGMLIVNVWLAVITFLGVVFVWRILKATHVIARETTRIGEAQTRGYLGLVGGSAVLRTDRNSVNLHNGFNLEFSNSRIKPIVANFSEAIAHSMADFSEKHKEATLNLQIGFCATTLMSLMLLP